MKTLWIVTVLAIIAISIGCLGGGGGGAEAAAKNMMEALRKGDVDAIFAYVDLKDMYDKLPKEQRGAGTYEEFVKQQKALLAWIFESNKKSLAQLEFEILGSEVKGDVTMVKIRGRKNKEAPWEEKEHPFKKVDGKWKTDLTALK